MTCVGSKPNSEAPAVLLSLEFQLHGEDNVTSACAEVMEFLLVSLYDVTRRFTGERRCKFWVTHGQCKKVKQAEKQWPIFLNIISSREFIQYVLDDTAKGLVQRHVLGTYKQSGPFIHAKPGIWEEAVA